MPTPGSDATPDESAAPQSGMPAATRRSLIAGGAALAAAGYVSSPALATVRTDRIFHGRKDRVRVTVLGTTDLHGNVYNWDYFKNAEYDDKAGNDIGIAKVATLVRGVRRDRRGEPIMTIDAGDTIQGTPLAYYYAKINPISDTVRHPMARAMNRVGYDAAALGNHEFNYGIDLLRRFESQLNFPLLGANAVDPHTKRPVFPPYITRTFRVGDGRKVKIGILGLTNPGIAIWDKANVEGKMEFPGLVEQAQKYVRILKRREKCDLVVISAHSGADTSSSYGDALPYPENAASLVAEHVPHVDAILVGHAHQEIDQRFVRNKRTGQQVLLCEPYYWGMRLAVMDFVLQEVRGRRGAKRWVLVAAGSQLLNSNTAEPDARVANAVREQHETVVAYVNSPIGTSVQELSAARAVVEDVPIIDLVNYIQADAVKAGLTGADATLPVLSIAAPFNRQASFPAGQVTVRDVAGLYIYDNTLLGVKVTGAEVRAYLEYSARYFKTVTKTTATMAEVTNAVTPTAPNGTPDYNFDTVAGLDGRLTYDIDLAEPVGSRIKNLSYDGAPIVDTMQFAMAVNNYRQSGGGGFPAVSTAPVVYNRQNEIRQLIIDWVTEHKTIDPAEFASTDWRLVSNVQPITITG